MVEREGGERGERKEKSKNKERKNLDTHPF